MFSSTGRVLCRTCGCSTKIVMVEHETVGQTLLHLKCFNCEEMRVVKFGVEECQEPEQQAA